MTSQRRTRRLVDARFQGHLPHVAFQGWLIVQDDAVTLTTAGLAVT
jgi:hypothetical protein